MSHGVLKDIVLILALSIAAAYAMRRLRIPAITGFILAGILVGPGGFELIADRASIETLAEVGVVLLLFGVGLKLSIPELIQLRRYVFGAGALQVVGTAAASTAIALAFGQPLGKALVWGYLLALSSTALVLAVLEERGEGSSAHGRFMLGVLLFQDLAVVPMMISLPVIGGIGRVSVVGVTLLIAKSLAVLAVIGLAAHFLFPWVMERVVRTRSPELFTLAGLFFAFGTALFVAEFGLSMALGAFLGGIVLSESEYAQQMLAEISPLRDAFNSLFFVSIGMLVDPRLWFASPGETLVVLLTLVVIKGLLIFGIAAVSLRSVGSGLIAAAGLSHAGEFSFVIAGAAVVYGLFDGGAQALFLAITAPTMLLAPPAFTLVSRFARSDSPRGPGGELEEVDEEPGQERVILVGYGINGRNVARALRLLEVPYVILELNAGTVRKLREAGEPVLYADATREAVLRKAGITRARALVIAIADAAASRQIVASARAVNRSLKIVVRTRYVAEIEALDRLGADEVIPEEFETSLELTGRVLAALGAPEHLIEREKHELRKKQYGALRTETGGAALASLRTLLGDVIMQEIVVEERSRAQGRSLSELDLRRTTRASVLALRRGDELITNPEPDLELAAGDEAFLIGTASSIESASAIFRDELNPE